MIILPSGIKSVGDYSSNCYYIIMFYCLHGVNDIFVYFLFALEFANSFLLSVYIVFSMSHRVKYIDSPLIDTRRSIAVDLA